MHQFGAENSFDYGKHDRNYKGIKFSSHSPYFLSTSIPIKFDPHGAIISRDIKIKEKMDPKFCCITCKYSLEYFLRKPFYPKVKNGKLTKFIFKPHVMSLYNVFLGWHSFR